MADNTIISYKIYISPHGTKVLQFDQVEKKSENMVGRLDSMLRNTMSFRKTGPLSKREDREEE